MLPFLPLTPSTPEDELVGLVDAVILIPDAPYHVPGLYMKRSEVRLQNGQRIEDPGLFTSNRIEAGRLIGNVTKGCESKAKSQVKSHFAAECPFQQPVFPYADSNPCILFLPPRVQDW